MSTPVTLILGDGIGPEVMDATLRVMRSAGADLEYDEQLAGLAALESLADPLPDRTLDSIQSNRVVFKGPLTTPSG